MTLLSLNENKELSLVVDDTPLTPCTSVGWQRLMALIETPFKPCPWCGSMLRYYRNISLRIHSTKVKLALKQMIDKEGAVESDSAADTDDLPRGNFHAMKQISCSQCMIKIFKLYSVSKYFTNIRWQ